MCVVHGAGPQISEEMERFGLPVEFVGGRRVTSAAALAVVRGRCRRVNAELCAALGERAVGLIGDEIGLAREPSPRSAASASRSRAAARDRRGARRRPDPRRRAARATGR